MPTEPTDTLRRVRRTRREISREHGHDPARLVAHYIALQEASPHPKAVPRPASSTRRRLTRSSKP